jgi:hypothetical protein
MDSEHLDAWGFYGWPFRTRDVFKDVNMIHDPDNRDWGTVPRCRGVGNSAIRENDGRLFLSVSRISLVFQEDSVWRRKKTSALQI